MSDLDTWDVNAAGNNAAPPDGWPETTMNYSEVNNSARENMAALARFWKDSNGELQLGGAVDAYTLTLNASYSAYFQGMYFAAEVNITNTGAATLNVNGIGPQSIVKRDGNPAPANAMVAGGIYEFRYDGTNFQLMGTISDIADLSLGSLRLTDVTLVDLVDDIAPLVVSPGSGAHLELDSKNVQAKVDETTASTLNLNAFGGDVFVGAAASTVFIDGTTSVGLTDPIAPLIISPGVGQHLELDGDEIQSKSDATTAARLNLNRFGGEVFIGAQLNIGTVKLFDDGSERLATTATGVTHTGSIIDLANAAATETALRVFNSAGGVNHSVVATTANARISQLNSAGVREKDWLTMTRNGGVAQYFNGVPKTVTDINGIQVGDGVNLGVVDILSIPSSGGRLTLRGGGADLDAAIDVSGNVVRVLVNDQSEVAATFAPNAGVSLRYDTVPRFATTSVGADVLGTLFDVDNSSAATAAEIRLRNSEGGLKILNDGGNIQFLSTNSAGTTVDEFMSFVANARVNLFYNGDDKLRTALETTVGTGAEVVDGNGTFRPIGYNVSLVSNIAALTDLRLANASSEFRSTSTSGDIDIDTTTNNAPDGSHWSGQNDSGGNITITATGVTLTWLDGAGGQTGNRTVADGSYWEIMKRADGQYRLVGNGIS